MTEEREFEGKDLEEALDAASASLGIPEADLHYEIVEQGRRGVFGLGVKSVRIRIMPPVETLSDRAIRQGSNETRPRAAQPRAPSGEGREVERTIQHMLELMGLEIETKSSPQENGLSLELEGSDKKMLLERNAELLSALQLLVNRMSRRAWPNVGRIQLSCNGGSQRREEEIVALTREVAQQVSRTGRTKRLQPLNAYERRLVHLTVREFAGLSSNSDGHGSLKRVRISKVRNELEPEP